LSDLIVNGNQYAPGRCLFECQYLRGRRLTTDKTMAAWLEISERTVFAISPICSHRCNRSTAEAGVVIAYMASLRFTALMLIRRVEALTAARACVQSWSSPQLRRAAESAWRKSPRHCEG